MVHGGLMVHVIVSLMVHVRYFYWIVQNGSGTGWPATGTSIRSKLRYSLEAMFAGVHLKESLEELATLPLQDFASVWRIIERVFTVASVPKMIRFVLIKNRRRNSRVASQTIISLGKKRESEAIPSLSWTSFGLVSRNKILPANLNANCIRWWWRHGLDRQH